MCPTLLLAVVEVGGGTELLPAVSFSEFGLVNPSSYQDSILSQEETQWWVCCVDNRHDRLSSLRRITWFIPGLIVVIQTAFKCAPIVLTRFRIGHRGTPPIGAKTARLDQGDLDTKWSDLTCEDFGEPFHPPFRGLIGTQSRRASTTTDRGDLYNVSRSLFAQDRESGSRHVDHPPQVRFDLGAPVFFGSLLDRPHVSIPCIIDHHIDPAKGSDGGGDRCANLLRIGHVKCYGTHLLPIR